MPGKPGSRWGERRLPAVAHVPNGPRKTAHVADQANGESVPRCRSCGLAASKGNSIFPGTWAYVRLRIPLDLCARCVAAFIPDDRTITDPLTLDEVA